MAKLYIAFVDTPGFFAGIIRRVIKQKYIHVAISLDPYLEEAYSIGRRHPSVPLIAGFEKEDTRKILKAFPNAEYMICSIECTTQQKKYVEQQLCEAMEQRFRYHYAVAGLPFILLNIPFYQKNHYTCSSYLAKILEQAGICRWEKHFSLVTPKDFMEYKEKQKIFEGSLFEFNARYGKTQKKERAGAFSFMQPAYAGAASIIHFLKRGVNYER
nr:hypothetical protein [uncultured Mediterraneibacter sp.]